MTLGSEVPVRLMRAWENIKKGDDIAVEEKGGKPDYVYAKNARFGMITTN